MSTPAAVLDGVTVVRAGTRALQEVDLTVQTGERVAVLGPSGAGKSTLVAVLNGSLPPTTGRVAVLGQAYADLAGRQRRRHQRRVGTVYQQLDLVGPLRVVHNVNAGRLGSWSLPRAAWSLVRPQQVADAVAVLDRVGLADRVFDRTDALSGGQQQRVALARLVRQDPDLVLADEPVSSLDPALADRVLALLTELARGRTLVTSLHRPDLARRYCDRLVGLRAGRVVLDAPAAEVDEATLTSLYR